MKEVYLVMESSGDWEEYRTYHTGTAFLSLLSAEKVKQSILDYNATEEPCPVDMNKYDYFGTMSEEDENLYAEWQEEVVRKREFRGCWIETLALEE